MSTLNIKPFCGRDLLSWYVSVVPVIFDSALTIGTGDRCVWARRIWSSAEDDSPSRKTDLIWVTLWDLRSDSCERETPCFWGWWWPEGVRKHSDVSAERPSKLLIPLHTWHFKIILCSWCGCGWTRQSSWTYRRLVYCHIEIFCWGQHSLTHSLAPTLVLCRLLQVLNFYWLDCIKLGWCRQVTLKLVCCV